MQKAYLNDPLCHPVGSYRGVSNMLLGVRSSLPSLPISPSLNVSKCTQGEAILTKDYKKWPKDLPLLIVHGTGDNVRPPSPPLLRCPADLALTTPPR